LRCKNSFFQNTCFETFPADVYIYRYNKVVSVWLSNWVRN
jgi:hypothetical protein